MRNSKKIKNFEYGRTIDERMDCVNKNFEEKRSEK